MPHLPVSPSPNRTKFSKLDGIYEALSIPHRFRFGTYRTVLVVLFLFVTSNILLFTGQLSTFESTHTVTSQDIHDSQSVLPDWGRVVGQVADGRVVVTGGGGNLGKHMVRRLLASSTPVTVLDVIFHQDELDDIYTDIPHARDLLRVRIGDIRDPDALHDVLTPDVVGVVHLAAVSRVLWCLENEPDCMDVNERGTELVLEALANLNRGDKGRRWFVLASSREIYGNTKVFPVMEDSAPVPANVYGESKLRAERALDRFMARMQKDRNAGSVYAIALRLSNTYGGAFDHVERLIPSIVTQALSHQVIQIVGGKQNFDLLHIDDCIDAFLLAVKQLTKLRRKWSITAPRVFLDAYNIASGSDAPVDELIDNIVRYTRSKSPIQYIPGDDRFPNAYRGNTDKALHALGFRAAVGIDEGVMRLVRLYLRRTELSLAKEIDSKCGEASPSVKVNKELHKLNDCSVHVSLDVQGESAVLGSTSNENHWNAETVMPPEDLRSYIRSGANGKLQIAIKLNNKDLYMGVLRSPEPSAGPIMLDKLPRPDNGTGDYIDWELDVNAAEGTLKFILPGTGYQLKPPVAPGGPFHLVRKELAIWPFRVSPICCEAPPPWPFFQDDPVSFMTGFQRTSLERPYLASPNKALCDRLSRARRKIQRDLVTLSISTLAVEPRRKESTSARQWANADLPACSNVCSLPTVCVDTGDCQCVLSSCVARDRFPFIAYANLPMLSYPPATSTKADDKDGKNPLLDMVARSSWLNVLRPHASRFVGTKTPWPRVHVAELTPVDKAWREGKGKDIHLLTQGHCFSADTSMERALGLVNVQKGEAEFVFVPLWQARSDQSMLNVYDYSVDTNPFFDPEKVVIPFTHDWGLCLKFEWNVWDMRKKQGLVVSPYVRSATAWTVMGDLNSPCYRPHQDVVIPPRTCLSPSLISTFGDMAKVRPARDRRVLATFKGTPWGTGKINRMKLTCRRKVEALGKGDIKLVTKHELKTLWDTTGDYKYMDLLGDTIFCPQPAGTTGWATRLVDAVYAGCIPVLVGESAEQPFFDMIDWSKISVRIDPADLNRVEEILRTSYTLEDVERLQANIMLVRDAFVYPLDGTGDEEVRERMLERRGPLWFALHSTKMRMLTRWPMEDVYDRP